MAKGKVWYYAVKKGRVPGVYMTWDDCEQQVKGFQGGDQKKFPTKQQAEAYINGSDSPAAATPASTSVPDNHSKVQTVATSSKGKKRTFDDLQLSDSISEISDSPEPLVVYCDGACKGNGKPGSYAGIGVWWGPNDPRNLSERCPGEQTNNRAELVALARVLQTTPFRRGPLTIKTDSKYVISCFDEWFHKWSANGWRKTDKSPVKNVELIKFIATLLDSRFRIGQKVYLEHVFGHRGIEGNEGADALANEGSLMPSMEELDWDGLREEYEARVEALIQARKIQLAQKDNRGSLEVRGIDEASADAKKDIEALAAPGPSSQNKVRRVGEVEDASMKDFKVPVVPVQFNRRYSAGVSQPNTQDLESYAQAMDEEEEKEVEAPPPKVNASSLKLFSAQAEKIDDEDLKAYADALDDSYDLSD